MRALSVLLVLVLAGAACSDDSDDGDDAGDATTTSSPVTASTAAASTTTVPGASTTSSSATAAEVGPVVIDAADPAISLTGRWDASNAGAPWAGWAGASIAVRFEGTGLGVHLTADEADEYVRVVVDGDVLGAQRLLVEDGDGEDGIVPVVEDLPFGWHTVEVVKETGFSDLTFRGLTVIGTGALEPLPAPDRRIVFYGDSNLAGHSLMHERDQPDPRLYGTYYGYAGITARIFDAAFHNISWSGSTISGVEGVFDAHDRQSPDVAWDLDAFPADVVVMNLGANDIYGTTKDDVLADYLSMLATLRSGHPDSHIVVFNAFGWSFAEPANYTHELLDLWDDDDFSVATFPWVFEQFHGTEYDHGGMAMVLADHLEQVMGWEAGEQDVMSGFGRDGDVANGSFEEVAPFGGFGWRYADEVERVVDADEAYEGDAHVVLSTASSIHQPTPIAPGQTVTVTGWVRNAMPGSDLDVTIDFRNQQQWTDPLSSETFTVDGTDEWTSFSFDATAPDDPTVFHTRVTFSGGFESAVRLDAVIQTIE